MTVCLRKIGDRVQTCHGVGTIVERETARDSWPDEKPERRVLTGRRGVKLDRPHGFSRAVAYYWPKEMSDILLEQS